MKRIDLENHFYDQCLIDALSRRLEPPRYLPSDDLIQWTDAIGMPQGKLLETLLEVGEERLALMERRGITHAVLSCSPGAEQLDAAESITVCRATNAALYELSKRYPGRVFGSAILPVKDIDAAVEELTRCVSEYGFVAWHTHSNYGATAPDHPRYRPLFQKAAELGVYVYLHPQLPEGERYEGYGFTFAGPGLGFTVDTVTTLLRMVVSGLLDDIPGLKLVLGHLGEGLPFLMERIENRIKFLPNPLLRCKKALSYYFKHHIWVTTSGNMSQEAFRCTKDVLGIDHILFASDYPFESVGDMTNFVDALPLTEEERTKLYYQNAETILGIPAQSKMEASLNE
ncbi:MAG: amidohydrolase [Clostridia bacterium]|nr:amidohydrolase [Clostridia bacterium]